MSCFARRGTRRLSEMLDATAILQNYSRLVIDCNRNPGWVSAFPVVSETTAVPGNEKLDEIARAARRMAIFNPYHEEIGRLISTRPLHPSVLMPQVITSRAAPPIPTAQSHRQLNLA